MLLRFTPKYFSILLKRTLIKVPDIRNMYYYAKLEDPTLNDLVVFYTTFSLGRHVRIADDVWLPVAVRTEVNEN
jgi:hypothetical protein